MPPKMANGLCIVYLASQERDEVVEVQVAPNASLEAAARTARGKVEMLAFASARPERRPVGFMIENGEGDELYRWYIQAS